MIDNNLRIRYSRRAEEDQNESCLMKNGKEEKTK